jgi:FKBP-type peptidyl-prolyl cis-trans isomerase
LKPNLVSSGNLFDHAYTRSEFTEGVLLALRDVDNGMTELAVGERSGITIPTRYAFAGAG